MFHMLRLNVTCAPQSNVEHLLVGFVAVVLNGNHLFVSSLFEKPIKTHCASILWLDLLEFLVRVSSKKMPQV